MSFCDFEIFQAPNPIKDTEKSIPLNESSVVSVQTTAFKHLSDSNPETKLSVSEVLADSDLPTPEPVQSCNSNIDNIQMMAQVNQNRLVCPSQNLASVRKSMEMPDVLNVVSWNVRGCNRDEKRKEIEGPNP